MAGGIDETATGSGVMGGGSSTKDDMIIAELDGPDMMEEDEEAPAIDRIELSYKPCYQRFRAKAKSFTQQYSHMYTNRLLQMRALLKEAAVAKWGAPGSSSTAPTLCERVIDLVEGGIEHEERKVMLIGTLFKDMPLRPSVLDEYRDEATLAGPLQPVASYTSPEDFFVLEDESGRVTLAPAAEGETSNSLPVSRLCTGLVVAVVGHSGGGNFVVEDWCTAGIPPQPASKVQSKGDGPQYVLLTSGVQLKESSDLLPLQMLIDYVGGHLGGMADRREVISRIGRVVIAGDLLAPFETAMLKEKHMSQKQQQEFALPFKHLDLLLSQLAAAVPVDVMPGSDDPSNFTLPQQPLHHCLLPRSCRYTESFRLVTNPYEAWIGGRLFLGGSGQIPEDMVKYTEGEGGSKDEKRSLQLLEETLQWRHMAPTAPDTLSCYPFCDTDPFVLSECPHVYFVGNQKRFATSFVQGPNGQRTRVVCVPAFHQAREVVLVELKTLSVTPIRFPGLAPDEASN